MDRQAHVASLAFMVQRPGQCVTHEMALAVRQLSTVSNPVARPLRPTFTDVGVAGWHLCRHGWNPNSYSRRAACPQRLCTKSLDLTRLFVQVPILYKKRRKEDWNRCKPAFLKIQIETVSLFPRLQYPCSGQWVPPRQRKTSQKRDI